MNAAVRTVDLTQLHARIMQVQQHSLEQAQSAAILAEAKATLARVNQITNAKLRKAMQAQVMKDCNVLRGKAEAGASKRVALAMEYSNHGKVWA